MRSRYLQAVLLGSTSVIVGLIWDICWHRSIGRDAFWSPPHLAIYLGGVAAGLGSAVAVLDATLARDSQARQHGVRVWGFKGPLGAFLCCWGSGAMLTSAPFDDWWHNAYGLDVAILSPPHVVLALGIMSIQVGALVATAAEQNRSAAPGTADAAARRSGRFLYAGGLLLTTLAVLVYEKANRLLMHHSSFYQTAGLVFPFVLLAVARASNRRFAATQVAGVYTALLLLQLWLLPLFPAEPRLGPVRNPVDHFVPLQFPLLLMAPALCLDLLLRGRREAPGWRTAVLAGPALVLTLLLAQWPFASFLVSPASRNALFGTGEVPYFADAASYLGRALLLDAGPLALARGLLLAVALAMLSARAGLAFGGWMSRVAR